jgi:hypothetical protein
MRLKTWLKPACVAGTLLAVSSLAFAWGDYVDPFTANQQAKAAPAPAPSPGAASAPFGRSAAIPDTAPRTAVAVPDAVQNQARADAKAYAARPSSSPAGVAKGSDLFEAGAHLGSLGFTGMGRCPDGSLLYVIDPVNICVAVNLYGTDKVEGASTFLSKRCLALSPSYQAMRKALFGNAEPGPGGWEKTTGTASPVSMCLRDFGPAPGSEAPKFIGFLNASSTPDGVDAYVAGMGGTMEKKWSDGRRYAFPGGTVEYRFCPGTGRPVLYEAKVDKPGSVLAGLAAKARVMREDALFTDMRVKAKFDDKGLVDLRFEYFANEKACP